jgi:hypothetical protein
MTAFFDEDFGGGIQDDEADLGQAKGRASKNSHTRHYIDMCRSPAWRMLPDKAHRILRRLELEHMEHGGADNGRLVCTFNDFEKAGVRRHAVRLAIHQCVALGFVEVMRQGRRSIADARQPSLYRLTYVRGRNDSPRMTNEWQLIATDEEAAKLLPKKKIPGVAIVTGTSVENVTRASVENVTTTPKKGRKASVKTATPY